MALELLHVFPSFAPGGIQMRLRTLIQGLPEAWQHQVLALDGVYSALELPGWPENVAPVSGDLPDVSGKGIFGRVQAVRRWLKDQSFGVVITNNWGAMEWAAAASTSGGIAHIHTESGFGPDEAFQRNKKRGWFRRLVLRRSDAILLCSQTLVGIAQNEWKLPKARTHFVPDGIDIARFTRTPDMPHLVEYPDEACVIGCVAPLRAEKNLGALLEAFDMAWQKNDLLRLAIAGDGPERAGLEATAKALPSSDAITFCGFLDPIEQFLAAIDICTLSSDTEQLPNSILQAMAMGLPIAAFGVGDIPIMTAQENADFLPERRDVDGLAAAFLALAKNADLRASIGAANQAKCQAEFNQGLMVDNYRSAIESAVSGREIAV